MQREDLFLKQLHQFMRFLQKWLQKNDLSKVEINELEAEGISKEFLEILNTDTLEANHLKFLSTQPEAFLKELIKICLQTSQKEKSKTIYDLYKTKTNTIDLNLEQALNIKP
jgi:elongation factor P--beta-lysine ligase